MEAAGYHEIGMDHFALDSDPLMHAKINQKLHRNFMGYTPAHTDLMVGLGASSISNSWTAFVQSEKKIEAYQEEVNAGQFPIIRGHLLSKEDENIRQQILELMCQNQTDLLGNNLEEEIIFETVERLKPLIDDGLVKLENTSLSVLPEGLPFIRNTCMAFDQKLEPKATKKNLFRQVV